MLSRPICFAAVLLASLASATAFAADAKRLPATDCLLYYDDPNIMGLGGWERGGMQFSTSEPVWHTSVICPLTRTNTTNTNGLTALRVNLTKLATTPFSCTAQSIDRLGSVLDSYQATPVGSNHTYVDFGGNINVSNSTSTYAVSCTFYGSPDQFQRDLMESVEYTEP